MDAPYVIGIMLGDVTGIGPEVAVKSLANKNSACSYLIIGAAAQLAEAEQLTGAALQAYRLDDPAQAREKSGIYLWDTGNPGISKIKLGQHSPYAGKLAGDTLCECLKLLQKGVIDGLTFAPLNKSSLKEGGYDFEDEHRMFAHYLGWQNVVCEINVLDKVWTTRVTSHIPLADVAGSITREKILAAALLLDSALNTDGYQKRRIAIAALNPHAGDHGACGREEIDIIAPAVAAAQKNGIDASGPYAADTLFVQAIKRGLFDGIVTMYHDQGQIALKTLGFEKCVTISGGLPYPITTPAHGTAYDIAGKNSAAASAFMRALEIAENMAMSKKH